MDSYYFNRYNANVDYCMNILYEYKNVIEPSGFNTTEEEVLDYLCLIKFAQEKNAKYVEGMKIIVNFIIAIAILFFSLIIEKTFNSDPLWYIGAFVASGVLIPIVLIILYDNQKYENLLRQICGNVLFPPNNAYVEGYLNILLTKDISEQGKREKKITR